MHLYSKLLLAILATTVLYGCTKKEEPQAQQKTTYTLNDINGQRSLSGYFLHKYVDSTEIVKLWDSTLFIWLQLNVDNTLNLKLGKHPSSKDGGITLIRTTKTFQYNDEATQGADWIFYELVNGTASRTGLHYHIATNSCIFYNYIYEPARSGAPARSIHRVYYQN